MDRPIRKFLRYLKPYKWQMIAGISCILVSLGFGLLVPYLVGVAVDDEAREPTRVHAYLRDHAFRCVARRRKVPRRAGARRGGELPGEIAPDQVRGEHDQHAEEHSSRRLLCALVAKFDVVPVATRLAARALQAYVHGSSTFANAYRVSSNLNPTGAPRCTYVSIARAVLVRPRTVRGTVVT